MKIENPRFESGAPSTPPPHRLRRRLWLAGLGTLLFLTTLATVLKLTVPGTALLGATPGADLIPSYMAGCFVREGRPDKLMSFPEAVRFQAHLRRLNGLEQHGRTGPWLNPPWFAWVFVPLSALPWPAAQKAWFGFNLLLTGVSVMLLCRMLVKGTSGEATDQSKVSAGDADRGLPAAAVKEGRTFGRDSRAHADAERAPRPDWRTWALIPLLMVTSMPFLQATASQQNTFISLAVLAATASFWRRGQGLAAGLVAGLLLFKPQLAAVVAVVLVCSLGRRALLGLLVTGTALLVLAALTMPGSLGDYLHRLPASLPWLRNGSGSYYAWQRQATFQGFWRMLFTGPVGGPSPLAVRGLWPACALAAGAAPAPALWRAARDARAGRATLTSRDRLIAATVSATPLLMPYYMDYDLLLLAVPAVLFAAERCGAGTAPGRAERLLLAGWVSLFPLLFINAAFAGATRVSLTVPLLAAMAGLSARRAAEPARGVEAEAAPDQAAAPVTPVPLPAAA